MGFSTLKDSLRFYDLRQKNSLRLLFLLIYVLQLGRTLAGLKNKDLEVLISTVLNRGLELNPSELQGLVTAGVVQYLLITVFVAVCMLVLFYFVILANTAELEPLCHLPDESEAHAACRQSIRQLRQLSEKFQEQKILRLRWPLVVQSAEARARAAGRKQAELEDIKAADDELQDWLQMQGSDALSLLPTHLIPAQCHLLSTPWSKLFWMTLKKLPQLLLLGLAAALIFVLSFPILGLPFVVLALALFFAPLYMSIHKEHFFAALKRSFQATRGYKMMMFSRFVLLFIICTLPTVLARRLFPYSPYSFAILDALSRTLLLLIWARQAAVFYLSLAHSQREGSVANA